MGNIYINKTEQGTWDCSIGESGNGVLLVKEKGYPVELYYTRLDLNGSSILGSDVYENQQELIKSLKWHGQCNHLIEKIWDFKLDTCANAKVVKIFDDAYATAMDNICKELDRIMKGMEEDKSTSINSTNTKIEYMYRDGDNWKSYFECVVKGILSEEQKNTILSCLDGGQHFIPEQVGLPGHGDDWVFNEEFDQPWFELLENRIQTTRDEATEELTIDELVEAFLKAKDHWDISHCLWAQDLSEEELKDLKETYGLYDANSVDEDKKSNEISLDEKITGAKKESSKKKADKNEVDKKKERE